MVGGKKRKEPLPLNSKTLKSTELYQEKSYLTNDFLKTPVDELSAARVERAHTDVRVKCPVCAECSQVHRAARLIALAPLHVLRKGPGTQRCICHLFPPP